MIAVPVPRRNRRNQSARRYAARRKDGPKCLRMIGGRVFEASLDWDQNRSWNSSAGMLLYARSGHGESIVDLETDHSRRPPRHARDGARTGSRRSFPKRQFTRGQQ